MDSTPVDLRSDTVTRPTAGMQAAISSAEVGDDVIDVDPTVDRLQRYTAEVLGKEAAVFMPSGTMTNQIAIRVHCKPGDELLCESDSHIYNYEQGAFAQLSGVVAHTLKGDSGVLEPSQFAGRIRPIDDHMVRTRLVCLENTHNRGGGRVQPREKVEAICNWAHEHGLNTHLDGARLFNASVASGVSPAELSAPFDTVSVCFSKGLGAPVGSALAGSREAIDEARRHRKLFGGAMRQAGVIGAAALFGLEQQVERLAEDHENAQLLAAAVADAPGLDLEGEQVDTNIVIFRVDPAVSSAADLVAAMESRGVRSLPFGASHVRLVTHHDVNRAQAEYAGSVLKEIARGLSEGVSVAR